MRKIYSYYMTQRPPQIGAMPKEGLLRIMYVSEDETKEWVELLQMDAYARLEYDHELTEKEVSDYELIPEIYKVRMCRGDVLWIVEQLEKIEYDYAYDGYKQKRMIEHLIKTIS